MTHSCLVGAIKKSDNVSSLHPSNNLNPYSNSFACKLHGSHKSTVNLCVAPATNLIKLSPLNYVQ